MVDQSARSSLGTFNALLYCKLNDFVSGGFLLRNLGDLFVLRLKTVTVDDLLKLLVGHVLYCLLLGRFRLRLRRFRLRFSRFQLCPGFNLFGFRIKLGNFDIRLCFNFGLLDSLLLGRSKFVLTFLTPSLLGTVKILGRARLTYTPFHAFNAMVL